MGTIKRKRTLEVLGELGVHKGGKVATVVEDHVERLATGEASDGLLNAPLVFLIGLSFPGEDGDARGSDAIQPRSIISEGERFQTYAAAA